MKKILIITWLIILSGLSFIVYQVYFLPSTNETTPPNENTEQHIERNNNQQEENKETEPVIIEEELSYSEYLQKGDQYFAQQDYKNAIKYYQKATEENANSTTPFLKLGDSYLLNNQPIDALVQYQRIYNATPDLENIKTKLAKAHINSGNLQQAKDIIWELTASEPENEIAKYYQALILIYANEYTNAETLLKQLSENSTTNLKTLSQNFIDAYKLFSYYNEGDPTYLKTLLAKVMADNGEYNMAIHNLKDVIKAKTNYNDAWLILGYSYLKTNQINEAIDTLIQARTLQPKNPNTNFYLGMSYYLKNDLNNAAKSLQIAKDNNYTPTNQLDFILAEIEFQQGKYASASQIYENLLAQNNHSIEIYDRLITIYLYHIPNPSRRDQLSKSLEEKYPNEAITFTIIANIDFLNNKIDQAQAGYLNAIEINPNIDIAHLNLGKIYQEKGSTTLAKNHYKTAYSITNSSKIRLEAGQLYTNLNNQ